MHTEERLRLSGAENIGRETGGLMLSINGVSLDIEYSFINN